MASGGGMGVRGAARRRGLLRRAGRGWRRLNFEQRTAGVGALLLLVSVFGPFSWVEAAEIVVAFGVLALLAARAEGQRFHLPFGDGVVVAVAGAWAGALIMIRLFERPLGQNLLALACSGILVLAGLREQARRPPDDLPTQRLPAEAGPPPPVSPAEASAHGRGAAPGAQPHQGDPGGGGAELDPGGDDERLG
jgi:hypothetical protein